MFKVFIVCKQHVHSYSFAMKLATCCMCFIFVCTDAVECKCLFFFETLKNSKYDQMWLELSTRDWILKRKHLQVTECEQDTAGHYPLTCSGGQFIKNIWQIKHDPQQSSQCAMACRDIAKKWLRFLGGGPEDVANTNGAVRRHPPTLSVFPHFR